MDFDSPAEISQLRLSSLIGILPTRVQSITSLTHYYQEFQYLVRSIILLHIKVSITNIASLTKRDFKLMLIGWSTNQSLLPFLCVIYKFGLVALTNYNILCR